MAQKGPDGRFIEDGVGSPAHLTANHLAALERSKGGVPGAADFEALLGVVHDSADDKATKARVQALQTAAADARQATAKAERETKALDAKRVEHLRLMAAEKKSLTPTWMRGAKRLRLRPRRSSKTFSNVRRLLSGARKRLPV